jgi:S1-C subfamily serine protease
MSHQPRNRRARRSNTLFSCACPAALLASLTVLAPKNVTSAAPSAPLLAPAPGQRDGGPTDPVFKKVSEQAGPALVTVKFILKIEASGRMAEYFGRYADEGVETEVTGVMIDASGIVLVSNTNLGGYMAAMASRAGQDINVNPTDLKILIGDDTEGVKAKMMARDKDLDLAWIRVDDPKAAGKSFNAVSLTQPATPELGDRLYTIDRKGKFFDHATTIHQGRLGGTTRKPRTLLIPTGLPAAIGMPVFDSAGNTVGITVVQSPGKEDMEGGDMSDLMSGGGFAFLIVPASEVASATARSKALDAEDKPSDAAASTTTTPDTKMDQPKPASDPPSSPDRK